MYGAFDPAYEGMTLSQQATFSYHASAIYTTLVPFQMLVGGGTVLQSFGDPCPGDVPTRAVGAMVYARRGTSNFGLDLRVDFEVDPPAYTVTVEYIEILIDRTAGQQTPGLATVVSAKYNDIMVSAWFGAASGGVKPLYVSVLRGAQKNIGAGSGSSAGEDSYTFSSSIDERSSLGLVILPGGDLVMSYDTYDASGNKTAVYVKNRQFGLSGAWSAAANLTRNLAQKLQTGRAQAQGMGIFQGS